MHVLPRTHIKKIWDLQAMKLLPVLVAADAGGMKMEEEARWHL
jgi:hypothetical protein